MDILDGSPEVVEYERSVLREALLSCSTFVSCELGMDFRR